MNDELDAEFAARITSEAMSGDNEEDHCNADRILIDLLHELGCHKTIAAFDEVGKWYS